MIEVPIEISARHIHLAKEDLEILFGKDYQLKGIKSLSQTGQFAAQETVSLKTEKGVIKGVRVAGPIRAATQVEISQTEARELGLNPPIRRSGDLDGSSSITLVGPRGEVKIAQGVILAWRHIHASPEDAQKFGLKDNQFVSIKIVGERTLTFHNVRVRVNKDFVWACHVDTDEANAAGIKGAINGEVIV